MLRYVAAMAILAVLAIGNGWSPFNITIPPLSRSIAATPTLPRMPRAIDSTCCCNTESRVVW